MGHLMKAVTFFLELLVALSLPAVARAQTAANPLAKALADLDAQIRNDPKQADAYHERGCVHFKQGAHGHAQDRGRPARADASGLRNVQRQTQAGGRSGSRAIRPSRQGTADAPAFLRPSLCGYLF